ncbi:hypothetical protein ACKWTF_003748 [Chironomus riparius]
MVKHTEDPELDLEAVKELRKLILDKITNGDDESVDGFHPKDLLRINQDFWVTNFLVANDYNMKESFKQCWDTLEWRKKFGVNDITEETVPPNYLENGNVYIRGEDVEGHKLMFFRIRIYSRGFRTLEGLKWFLLYWFERSMRAANDGQITVVLDMINSGLKNMDLEYIKLMINILKSYYPNSLSYILVYDMPWVMSGVFQIVKGLLPKKVVERMKFINSKTVRQYIDDENMPYEWGGLDKYELKFEPEVCPAELMEKEEVFENNNDELQENFNITNVTVRKVHFANLQESPMSDVSSNSQFENNYGDMLQLTPAETIVFQKNNNNEYFGNVEILNVGKKAITYKVKTTAPDKFRVRPSSGTLSPNNNAIINVLIQKNQHTLPVNKDKFLVMCMPLPDESLTNEEISNIWKEVNASSPVEQHRLKCAMPVTTAIINNLEGISDYFLDSTTVSSSNIVHSSVSHNGTKPTSSHTQQHLQVTVNQLSENVHNMQQQIKTMQSLQWITIFVFIMLSISIVYILKMEIQNSNSQYCIDNE